MTEENINDNNRVKESLAKFDAKKSSLLWDLERVKKELPTVDVKFKDGTKCKGKTDGANLPHCFLWLDIHQSKVPIVVPWVYILQCLNLKSPVKI